MEAVSGNGFSGNARASLDTRNDQGSRAAGHAACRLQGTTSQIVGASSLHLLASDTLGSATIAQNAEERVAALPLIWPLVPVVP